MSSESNPNVAAIVEANRGRIEANIERGESELSKLLALDVATVLEVNRSAVEKSIDAGEQELKDSAGRLRPIAELDL